MRLGLSTYACAWAIGVPGHVPPVPMNAEQFITRAGHHNFSCVQIADNLPLHIMSSAKLRQLKGLADAYQIDIEVGMRGLGDANLIITYLDLAAFFGSPLLRIVIDTPEYQPPLAEITARIKDLVPELISRQIKLAIENHDRLKAAQFLEIIDAVGSPWVGICLDTVNSMGTGEGFEEVFHTRLIFTSRTYDQQSYPPDGLCYPGHSGRNG